MADTVSGSDAIAGLITGQVPTTTHTTIAAPVAAPAPVAPTESVPTDPAAFQQYLNDHGANLVVDGIIGPLTRAAAAALGIPVPGDTPATTDLPIQGGDVVGPGGDGTDPVSIITRVANELGVDPKLALAIAKQESGLDPMAIGDGGHSVGLFQLNDQGEGAGMSVADRQNAETNARIALTQVAAVARAHPDWTPGQIAAAAQRPADQATYAQRVNALYQGGPITAGPTSTAPGAGGGAGSSTPAADLTPEQVQQQMRVRYGYLGGLLDRPDVAKVLTDGITQDKADNEILADLYNTDTWRSTQASARNWIGLTSQDPASAEAQIGQRQADIGVQAAKTGINISADRQRQIAIDSLKFGWDSTQLQEAIAAEFHYQPGAQTGQLGAAEGNLRSLAQQYMVPIDDATLAQYEMQIAQGIATPDTFRQQFTQHAQSLFPGLSQQITVDNPTSNVVAPWRNTIAQELGVAPETVDFTQPKWNRFLNQIDPKTGTPTPMSLYDTQRTIRGDDTYGWQYTKNGQDAGYQFQHAFLQAVGSAPA